MVKAMSNWYYCRNAQQQGPVTRAELKEAMERGDVDGDTYVWQAGMSERVRARKHPDLVSSILTPPPLPGSVKNATRPFQRVAASIVDIVRGKRSQ